MTTLPDVQPLSGHLKKHNLGLLTLSGLGFVALGFWMIYDSSIPWFGKIVGLLSILFFGFCTLILFSMLMTRRPGIRIDEKGIFDNSSGSSYGFIPWEEISTIETERNALIVSLKDRKQTLSHMKGIRKWLASVNLLLNGSYSIIGLGLVQINKQLLGEYVTKINHALINEAIEKEPNNPNHYFNRAMAFSRQNLLDLALANYSKAIEIKSDFAQAYNNRGNIHDKKQEYELALADFTKAIEISPDLLEAHNNRGNCLVHLNNLTAALDEYNRAIEIDPSDDLSYVNRAGLYYLKGQTDSAITDLKKAIKLDSTLKVEAKTMLRKVKKKG